MPVTTEHLAQYKWKPGQSGNPAGRSKGAIYVSDWLNSFLAHDEKGRPAYSVRRLQRIAEKDTSAAKRMAAQRILVACRDPRRLNGTLDPEPGRAMDSILARLEGKPRQTVTIERQPERSLAQIEEHLRQLLADPRVRLLAEHRIIDGEARVIE